VRKKVSSHRGPAFGFFPAAKSLKISWASLGFKSSWVWKGETDVKLLANKDSFPDNVKLKCSSLTTANEQATQNERVLERDDIYWAIQTYIVVVVDLHHGSVDAGTQALDLAESKQLVLRRLAKLDAQLLLNGVDDRVRVAKPARRARADLHVVLAHRIPEQAQTFSFNYIFCTAEKTLEKQTGTTERQRKQNILNSTRQGKKLEKSKVQSATDRKTKPIVGNS
jgi:hypothetical protein